MRRALTATLLAAPMAVAAEAGPHYLGVQYASVRMDYDALAEDFEPGVALARLGTHITEHFGIESRFGVGVGDDMVGPYTFEVESLFGAYAVGKAPLGPADAYVLGGFTSATAEGAGPGWTASDSESGLSYGAGVELYPADNVALNAEWVSYLRDDLYDATALSAGLTFRFR